LFKQDFHYLLISPLSSRAKTRDPVMLNKITGIRGLFDLSGSRVFAREDTQITDFKIYKHALIISFAAFFVFMFALPSQAAETNASPWAQSHNTSMRLIAGSSHKENILRSGIEIKLAPHFKTYWRTPGDSGVAPVISFEGSQNLKSAEVLFPAPSIFREKSGTTIGYKHHVIWPLHIIAQDATKPVLLNVKLDYGICEKICIPASGIAQISLSNLKNSEYGAQIMEAEDKVPQKQALGEGKDISITKITPPIIENTRSTFIVDVTGSQFLEILPEAKPDSWYLEAQVLNNIGNQFKITVFDPQVARGAMPCDIKLTVMNAKNAIEVPIRMAGCIE
jgi:DsbC/DsbD-like thiol-disulfide interchange protein